MQLLNYPTFFIFFSYRERATEASDVPSLALTELDVVHLVQAVEVCQAFAALGVTLGLTLVVRVLIRRAVQL